MSKCRDTRPITTELVRKFLDYDPVSGILRWRIKRKQMNPSDEAGCLNSQGYIVVTLLGRQYQGHRLAWLHFYGEWPMPECDHKDTIKHHNWISNLRESTRPQNNWNRTMSPKNKAGLKGVSFDRGKYVAVIYKHGKKISLGRHVTAAEAHQAYCNAAQQHFGEFWRPE